MPKISVALPCYNEAPHIEETLRSILAQTEDDFELIVSDNASEDGTVDIIRRVSAADSRVTILQFPTNMGAPANFYRPLDAATSPYFLWMSAHDKFAKNYLKKLRLVLDADPECALAYSDSIYIAKDGSNIPGESLETGLELSHESVVDRFKILVWKLQRCDMIHGMMRRTSINRKIDNSCRGADMVLLADLALRGKFRRVPELMFYRRRNRESEDPETWHKRLVEMGVADPAQSIAESWSGTRNAHIRLLEDAPLPNRLRHEMKLAVCQAFMERHGVPWDSSQDEARLWDRLQMCLVDESRRELIRERIRQRVAVKARIDDASSRAQMERELVFLLKENHRLRKELAKVKR